MHVRRDALLWGFLALAIPATGFCQTAVAPDPQRQQALALEQQGRNAEAEAAWRGVLKAHPSSPEPYAHLGLLEARQERYAEAVSFYRKALAINPAIPGLRMNLGLAFFKAGDLNEAIQEFSLVLKADARTNPEAQRATILIGMAHYGLAEYAAAVPYLKDAISQDAQDLPLRLTLAHSCLWSKQYQCVMDVYHEILSLNAQSAEADMLAGEALDQMKDHAGALQQFRAAVLSNPNEPDVHFGLGYLLWMDKRYEEAAREFQAELANNPNHAQALTYLADANLQTNHQEIALPLLEKASAANRGIELTHLDLGILYADAGRQQDALRELQTAAQLAPDDVNVHWRLGRLYRTMGDKEQAKAELDKASRLTKAADDALMDKIKNPGAKARPTDLPSGK